MRKITFPSMLLVLVMSGILGGCACTTVEQGYTGVLTDLYGNDKGGIEEVGPGRHWYNTISKDMYIFPNFVQRVAWTRDEDEGSPIDEAIRVLSQDQLEFTIDVGFSYYVTNSPGCSAAVFRLYRKPIERITEGPLRDIVRKETQDVFSQWPAADIYGENRPVVVLAVNELIQERLNRIQSDEGTPCFQIEDFALLEMQPPQSVKEAVERKIAAAQQAQTEREKLLAIKYTSQQDSIKAAMDSRNNVVLARSISPELLEWERLQLLKQKWDGKLPQVISGDGASSLLIGIGN